jgi:creatinine amidohydrolase
VLTLADATFAEVRDFLAADPRALVLLPVGSTEAHGPHLPLATDVIIAQGMCRRAAPPLEALGCAVAVAPAITYSVTDYAHPFAGTAGVSASSAVAYVKDVCLGLLRAGFGRVCLVNAHLEPAHVATLRQAAELATSSAAKVVLADLTEKRFGRTLTDEYKRGECHAGAYETSLVLAESAHLVRQDKRLALSPVRINLAKKMQEGVCTFTEAGALDAYFGDPAQASAEEGEWIYARLVEMIVTVVREAWP